jgi:hypothetical protein
MNPRTIQTVTLATLLSVAAPVVADTLHDHRFPRGNFDGLEWDLTHPASWSARVH